MSRQDYIILFAIIMVAISLGVVAMLHLDKKEKQCNDRGGILIKATSQWICVDKVFIK